jgi:uncharacterized membrane protein YcaP (DUF421 family)
MATIIRATVAYWVLLFVLRLLGRRAASQLSPFELIVMFLLGGMSIQAIVSDDRSLFTAVIGILTIAINHFAVSANQAAVYNIPEASRRNPDCGS